MFIFLKRSRGDWLDLLHIYLQPAYLNNSALNILLKLNCTINLTQERKCIGAIYFTFIETKTYIFQVSALPKSICNMITAKKHWRSKQRFAIHFPLATCNVCSRTIPEFVAQAQVSDYSPMQTWPTTEDNQKFLFSSFIENARIIWFCILISIVDKWGKWL